MKTKIVIFSFLLAIVAVSCSKNVNYTPEFIKETSGKYLFNQDDVIEVFYENNKLFLKWRGADKIEPVIIDRNTFFIVDLYKKLRFVKHPETNKQYLSIVAEDNENNITYDYLKVTDTFKTPSMYLKNGDYKNALAGFLEIKKQDSTSVLINEKEFNALGYGLLREEEYQNAIDVFQMNVALYPESDNAYDSLADAYLRSGDSLEAFNNYKKALTFNNRNNSAKKFIKAYSEKKN
ncbi:tetratricopeptide repeat protein [Lacinutrix sp. WUR7]|uniref:tetratricopeptide repeat protein n=1 Tax=Lacinutrix sp. WUR7 TaxID=2653681 RepID=UPI00193E8A19|nr:tetratricopeptide repeat protein [Lacinutrix sp. WUR7]QRM87753.1 tetratricopeptide repeat protein [Lacinutrix sp. WUR7]